MLLIIYYILFTFTFIYGCYFFITGLFLFKSKKNDIKSHKPKNKFACVIPARNEAEVIESLIQSLKLQNYPSNLVEIYVVPNNCTDNTKKIALENSAKVIECDKKIKSKGEALKVAFKKIIKDKSIDAFIIFDADNVVHPNFIKRMNDAMCSGYKVAQGFRDSKNISDSWISASYSIFYWGQNIFFNKARMNLKASASINGTGFLISRQVLETYGFNTFTMTEDIEFTAQCAINNIRIAFVQDAITYDEQPFRFGISWRQRKRWTTGTYQCLYFYYPKLIKGFLKNRNLPAWDMSLFFMAPLIQVIFFIIFILSLIITVNNMIEINNFVLFVVYNTMFSILAYFISVLIDYFIVKYNKKSVKESILGIFTFPLFLISWIPINIMCLFKKTKIWEPIAHTRNVNIENLIKK